MQTKLEADNDERQVVEPETDDSRGIGHAIVCPDCGQTVSETKSGGKPLPDDAPADACFGWSCDDCQNTLPSHTSSEDAPEFNDQMRGVLVEFRDGSERYVPVSAQEVQE